METDRIDMFWTTSLIMVASVSSISIGKQNSFHGTKDAWSARAAKHRPYQRNALLRRLIAYDRPNIFVSTISIDVVHIFQQWK
jgi:hypothetical protein